MWMALIAMAFYALEISITDQKLSSISPRLLTLIYASGVALFSFLSLVVQPEQTGAPSANQLGFISLMILASFIAASAHFEALHSGIGTAKLTLAYAFLPVAGALHSVVFRKEIPSLGLVLAWCFAVAALYLVSVSKPIPLSDLR